MPKVKKRLGKITFAFVLLCSIPLLVVSSACRKSSSAPGPAVDSGDEKLSAHNVAEAEPLYDGREDMAKARVAVATLRQARLADYGNYEAAWKLARAAYYVGDHTDSSDESDDMFREGIDAGKAAVKLQPDKPEGHFWLGANYGGSAAHSTLASLANVQDIRREMEAVLKIDERYQAGSAYMVLGRLYLQAPRVLGGDTGKAIANLEKGLGFGANNSLMRVYLAEAYENARRYDDARKQIEELKTMTPDPKFIPEHKDALVRARKLEEKMAGH
jgi:tetratricopeptide (TPR) repeat protein